MVSHPRRGRGGFGKRKPPRLRGGLCLVNDLLENVDQVTEIDKGDVTGKDLVFQVDGQCFKLGPQSRVDVGHLHHLKASVPQITKLSGLSRGRTLMKVGPYWFHRLEQWDLDCHPILCVHKQFDDRNGSYRVLCIYIKNGKFKVWRAANHG